MWWLWLLVFALTNSHGALQQRAVSTGYEATQEASSNLKVTGVYGVREDASSGLRMLKITLELPAGALPSDLSNLIVRYADGTSTTNYAHTEEDVEASADRTAGFSVEWIRGAGEGHMMEAGDLVQLSLVVPQDLPVRTSVETTMIPEVGSAVRADFKTPPTYGADLVITLR